MADVAAPLRWSIFSMRTVFAATSWCENTRPNSLTWAIESQLRNLDCGYVAEDVRRPDIQPNVYNIEIKKGNTLSN